MTGVRMAFLGASMVSAYWNSKAPYYRGITRQSYNRQISNSRS